MSDTHYEVNKKFIYGIGCFLVTCLISLTIYIYQSDWDEQKEVDAAQIKSINTNQQAIQATTDEMVANRQRIAVEQARVDGHVANPSAHNK